MSQEKQASTAGGNVSGQAAVRVNMRGNGGTCRGDLRGVGWAYAKVRAKQVNDSRFKKRMEQVVTLIN